MSRVKHSSGCGLSPEVEAELCNSVGCWLGRLLPVLLMLPVLFLLKCPDLLWSQQCSHTLSLHPTTVGSLQLEHRFCHPFITLTVTKAPICHSRVVRGCQGSPVGPWPIPSSPLGSPVLFWGLLSRRRVLQGHKGDEGESRGYMGCGAARPQRWPRGLLGKEKSGVKGRRVLALSCPGTGGSCPAIPSQVPLGVQSKSHPWSSTGGDSPPAPVSLFPTAAKGAVPKCPQACTSTPIIPSQLAA